MAVNVTSVDCVRGALPGGLQRTSFFNGMFLTQSDLEVEQRFWRMKRRLTNRALGAGVVWGLRLDWDAKARQFKLRPGYAIDCCGQDLVVQAPFVANEGALIDRSDPAIKALLPLQGTAELHLMLKYAECPEEPRPIHKDACLPESDACQTARVRETVVLTVGAAPPAPPKSPVDNFLDGVDALKQKHPHAFPGTADHADPPPKFPYSLVVRVGSDSWPARYPETGANPQATFAAIDGTVDYNPGTTNGAINFEVQPDGGWVLSGGTAASPQGNVGMPVTPPFALQLVWQLEFLLPQPGYQTVKPFSFHVTDLEFARVFGGRERFKTTLPSISGTLTVTGLGSNGARNVYRVEIANLVSTNPGNPVAVPAAAADGACLLPLVPSVFLPARASTDPSVVARTLLLGSLYTWLENSIGQLDPSTQGGIDNLDGRRLLGVSIYLAAWRVLFGANAADEQDASARTDLANQLNTLLLQWCSGFVYTGPRCPDSQHAVYLGCATVDPSGKVVAFDMWKGRRHVITGPLLNHWGAQLGFAPLDEVASRFVRSICCLGERDGKSHLALPALGKLPVAGGGTTQEGAAVLVTDGCYLLFGNPQDSLGRLAALGVAPADSQKLSWTAYSARLLESLQRQGSAPSDPRWVLYSVDGEVGVQTQLLIAESRDDGGVVESVARVWAWGSNAYDRLLPRGAGLPFAALASGLRLEATPGILLSRATDADCNVLLDVPFPITPADVELWDIPNIGFQIIRLAGTVDASDPRNLVWKPLPATAQWITTRLPEVLGRPRFEFFSGVDVDRPHWAFTPQSSLTYDGTANDLLTGAAAVMVHRAADDQVVMRASWKPLGPNTVPRSGIIYDWVGPGEYSAVVIESVAPADSRLLRVSVRAGVLQWVILATTSFNLRAQPFTLSIGPGGITVQASGVTQMSSPIVIDPTGHRVGVVTSAPIDVMEITDNVQSLVPAHTQLRVRLQLQRAAASRAQGAGGVSGFIPDFDTWFGLQVGWPLPYGYGYLGSFPRTGELRQEYPGIGAALIA